MIENHFSCNKKGDIMKKLLLVLLISLLLISGCTNDDLEVFNEEKELLTNEILELKEQISEKDEEILKLKGINKNVFSNKVDELRELTESLEMVRFSAYSRLNDYNDSFDNLKNVYKIESKHVIKDDWYVISDDYFQIELSGYENAKKVEFYTLRMESGEGTLLVFEDTDPTDGWIYINHKVSDIINKQIVNKTSNPHSTGFTYEPCFVIYTDVTMENGNVLRTSKLPIYYR